MSAVHVHAARACMTQPACAGTELLGDCANGCWYYEEGVGSRKGHWQYMITAVPARARPSASGSAGPHLKDR